MVINKRIASAHPENVAKGVNERRLNQQNGLAVIVPREPIVAFKGVLLSAFLFLRMDHRKIHCNAVYAIRVVCIDRNWNRLVGCRRRRCEREHRIPTGHVIALEARRYA